MIKRKLIALLTAIIMTVLLLPIGAFATADQSTIPDFSISIFGQAITKSDLSSLTDNDCTATAVTTNSKGVTKTTYYKGYRVKDVLTLKSINYDNGVIAKASDGYAAEFTKAQVDDTNTLLAYASSTDGITYTNLTNPTFAPCSLGTSSSYVSNLSYINERLPDFTATIGSKTIANADVKKLDVVSYSSTSTNSKGVTSTVTYKGYKLSDVLGLAGVDYTNGITVTGTDGFANKYSKDVVSNAKTLFAITKDSATTDGPFIAPCDSAVGKDYAKKVATIAATPVPAAPAAQATTAPVTTGSTNPKTDDNSYLYSSVIIIVASSFMIAMIEFKRKKVEE